MPKYEGFIVHILKKICSPILLWCIYFTSKFQSCTQLYLIRAYLGACIWQIPVKTSKVNGVKYYNIVRQSLFKKDVNLRLFSFPHTHSTELLCLLKCLFALFPDTSQKTIFYTDKIYWFVGKWKNFISSVSWDSINIYWVKKPFF